MNLGASNDNRSVSDESAGSSSNRRVSERKTADGHPFFRVSSAAGYSLQGYAYDYSREGVGITSLDEVTLPLGERMLLAWPGADRPWNFLVGIVRHSNGKRHGFQFEFERPQKAN